MSRIPALKSVALVTMTAAATSLLIQACGGGALAQSTVDGDAIEGAWDSTVTVKDCTTGATLNTFKGASLFHRGGTLSADNSMPPPTRGAAFGIWSHASDGSYSAKLWFTRFNADGSVAGSQKVVRTLALGADSNTLSGNLAIQVLNPAGVVVAQGCGAETGTRVSW